MGLIQETDRLLGQQYNDDTGYYDTVKVSFKYFSAEVGFSHSAEKKVKKLLKLATKTQQQDYLLA